VTREEVRDDAENPKRQEREPGAKPEARNSVLEEGPLVLRKRAAGCEPAHELTDNTGSLPPEPHASVSS
jgi:hypothetical protein